MPKISPNEIKQACNELAGSRIIQGDCLDVMKGMPDRSIDAIITDPPFGIGFRYGDNKDVANTADTYWRWFEPFYKEMLRVTKDGALIAIWQTQLYFPYFWKWFGDDIHIYIGCKNFVQLRKTPINYAYDPIIMFYKKGETLCPVKPKRNVDFFVSNTASLVSKPDRPERQHPCPRAVDIAEQIISNFSVGTVLDPFAGSGTIGVACKNLNRNYILIEKEKEYIDIINKRLL